MKYMLAIGMLALALVAAPATAHNEVVDVAGAYYVVVNDVEIAVSVWEETNGVEGLQTEDEVDEFGNVVVPADLLVAGDYHEEHHEDE